MIPAQEIIHPPAQPNHRHAKVQHAKEPLKPNTQTLSEPSQLCPSGSFPNLLSLSLSSPAAVPPPQMASRQHDHHRASFPVEEEDLDEDDDDVLDEDDANSASTSSSLPTATPVAPMTSVTVAVPSSSLALNGADPIPSASIPPSGPMAVIATPVPLRMETTPPDSRKLFQRLWTDEDEIELLQGFLEFINQRGGGAVAGGPGHHDTSLFYDQIKSKLQLDFNKNQLIEKLRRLKKKYRNIVNKISSGKDVSFKSPHDRATFEISRKIWTNITTASRGPQNDAFDEDDDNNDNSFSLNPNFTSASPNFASPNPNSRPIYEAILLPSNTRKRPRSQAQHPVKVEEKAAPAIDASAGPNGVSMSGGLSGIIEETVRSCLSPLFKELSNVSMFSGIPTPFSLSSGGHTFRGFGSEPADDRWRKQQVLELEVYSKRLELVQEQVRAKLEDLRSGR